MTVRKNKPLIPERYMALMAAFRLRPIATRNDYESAIRVMEPLMVRDDLSDDEDEYADVLATLIEQYEKTHFPIPKPSGVEMLKFLIEQSGRTQTQIAREAGLAESAMSEILKGKRGLGRKHVEAFARVFRINPGAFLRFEEPAGVKQD